MDAIYARQSIEKKDSLSIEQQIDMCKKSAADAVEIYKDIGYSGKNTTRPDFQRLLGDVKSGTVTRVICYRIDRISRNLLDFMNIWQLFQQNHVEFISVSEQFDTSTPVGKAMLYIAMVFAQMERETIGTRITDNFYARTAAGAWGGGPAPYGFKKVRGMLHGKTQTLLEPVPDEQENIKWMFTEYATGLRSLGWLGREMWKRDPDRGIRWTNVSLRRILINPLYAAADADLYAFFFRSGINIVSPLAAWDGKHSALQTGSRSADTRVRRPISEQQLSVFSTNPVVSSQTYIRVQKQLAKNRQIKNTGKGQWSWLSGKIKCAECGYSCTLCHSPGVTRTKAYIRCSGRYGQLAEKRCTTRHTETIESVEEYVLAQLKDHLSGVAPSKRSKKSAAQERKRNELKLQLIEVQQKQQNAAAAIAEGGATIMRLMMPEIEKLDAEATKITDELSTLAGSEQQSWMPDMALDFDAIDDTGLRDLVALTIDKVLVSPSRPPEIIWK